ncbi:unnamed protein product [Brassica rapa subsp. trilocularis]
MRSGDASNPKNRPPELLHSNTPHRNSKNPTASTHGELSGDVKTKEDQSFKYIEQKSREEAESKDKRRMIRGGEHASDAALPTPEQNGEEAAVLTLERNGSKREKRFYPH